MVITLYALTGDDIRIISFEKKHDYAFMLLNIFTLTLFLLELLLSSIGISGYFNSFFFWLDFISTLSIVLDIEPLFQAMLSMGGEESHEPDLTDYINSCTPDTSKSTLGSSTQV